MHKADSTVFVILPCNQEQFFQVEHEVPQELETSLNCHKFLVCTCDSILPAELSQLVPVAD
jgi:hypothetical protein